MGRSKNLRPCGQLLVVSYLSAGFPQTPLSQHSSAVLLVGLGAVDLSMTPSKIPRVRRILSGIDSGDARTIADECLNCETADEVEDLVRERFRARWPELFPPGGLPLPRPKK